MPNNDPTNPTARRTKATKGAPAEQASKAKPRTAPEDTRNVYQRVAAAMSAVSHVLKQQKCAGRNINYKYASEEDIILAVRPALLNEGVVFVASVTSAESEHIQNPKKPESALIFTIVKTQGRFISIDDPEDYIECQAVGHGIDRGDKSIGIAQTYAFKELLRHGVMCLATGEDPERYAVEDIPAQEAAGATPCPKSGQDVPANGRARMESEARPVRMEFGEMDKDLIAIVERATHGAAGSRMPEFTETRWRAKTKNDILEMLTEFREIMGGKPEDAPDGSTCPNSQLARMAGTEEYRAKCFQVLQRVAVAVGLEEADIMGAFQRGTSQRLWKCSSAEFEEGFLEFMGDVAERLTAS